MVTYEGLIQFIVMLTGVIALTYNITKKEINRPSDQTEAVYLNLAILELTVYR